MVAAEGSRSVVARDDQLGVEDLDGDSLAGADPAEGDALPGDPDHAGGRHPALNLHRVQ